MKPGAGGKVAGGIFAGGKVAGGEGDLNLPKLGLFEVLVSGRLGYSNGPKGTWRAGPAEVTFWALIEEVAAVSGSWKRLKTPSGTEGGVARWKIAAG